MTTRPSEQRSRSAAMGTRRIETRGFQIGPRVRVGGSVGKLGQKIKIGTGKLAENKWVDFGLGLIPGVGPGIAAAANAAGHVLDTSGGGMHSFGDVAKTGLDAGEAYLAGMAGNSVRGGVGALAHGGGVKDAAHALAKPFAERFLGKHDATDGMTEDQFYKSIDDGNTTPDDSGGGLLGTLTKYGSKVAGAVGGGGGGGGLTDKLLMAGAIAQTAADRQKQQHMMDQASKYATDSYDARAPLRAQALAGLTDPNSPANKATDLSSIYSNPGSVYDTQRRMGSRVPVGGAVS